MEELKINFIILRRVPLNIIHRDHFDKKKSNKNHQYIQIVIFNFVCVSYQSVNAVGCILGCTT